MIPPGTQSFKGLWGKTYELAKIRDKYFSKIVTNLTISMFIWWLTFPRGYWRNVLYRMYQKYYSRADDINECTTANESCTVQSRRYWAEMLYIWCMKYDAQMDTKYCYRDVKEQAPRKELITMASCTLKFPHVKVWIHNAPWMWCTKPQLKSFSFGTL